jgi:hypothetical protein
MNATHKLRWAARDGLCVLVGTGTTLQNEAQLALFQEVQ